jgi:hypothetical protein
VSIKVSETADIDVKAKQNANRQNKQERMNEQKGKREKQDAADIEQHCETKVR